MTNLFCSDSINVYIKFVKYIQQLTILVIINSWWLIYVYGEWCIYGGYT